MRLPTPNDDGSYASCNYRLLFKIISTYLCTVFKLILLRRQLHSVPLINWKSILTDFLIGYRICLLSISKWQVKSVFQNMYVAQLTKLLLGKFKNESEDTNWYWLSFVCEHLGNQLGEKNILECSLQNYSIFIAGKKTIQKIDCVYAIGPIYYFHVAMSCV